MLFLSNRSHRTKLRIIRIHCTKGCMSDVLFPFSIGGIDWEPEMCCGE